MNRHVAIVLLFAVLSWTLSAGNGQRLLPDTGSAAVCPTPEPVDHDERDDAADPEQSDQDATCVPVRDDARSVARLLRAPQPVAPDGRVPPVSVPPPTA